MLKNYLVIFLRKSMRRKAFTAINFVGLSVSVAGAVLIYLYVANELSFDRFNENRDRVFRMYAAYAHPGEAIEKFPFTPLNLGPTLAQDFDGIDAVTRIVEMSSSLMVRVGDTGFNESGIYETDSTFFKVFTGQFIAGSPRALNYPHSAVITRSAAERFFGSVDKAIDQEIKVSLYGEQSYTVTGIVADFPSNSHLKFSCLLSIDYANENLHPDNWLGHWPATYVLLDEHADAAVVQERIRQTTERILDPIYVKRYGKNYQEQKKAGGLQEYRLQPLRDVHLYSSHMGESGNILYIYIFGGIGIALICIASFNYINLSTARSVWEAKAAGIRKVLGASGSELYRQSITESTTLNIIAAVGGIVMAQLVLTFNSPFLQQFIPDKILSPVVCLVALAFSLLLGLISGSVPARLLAAFQPTEVLKGQLARGTKGNGLRQVLVTGQFVVSIGLIICTLVIGRQLNFMQSLSLGFDKDHLLAVKNVGNLGDRKATLKQSLANENFVVNSSLCYGAVGRPENSAAFTPVELIDQKREDIVVGIPVFIADNDYLSTLGVSLSMGHNFPDDLHEDHQQIILNKEALREVGWQDRAEKDIIGKMIDVNGRRYELAGIVDDYHFRSLRNKIGPMAILSHYWQSYEMLMVRLAPGSTTQAIKNIEDHWRQIAPGIPFQFSFIDEDLDRLYASEQNLGLLFMIFACVAIFVACLGLLGLAMFAGEKSVKEIGIRKVLGASVISIVIRLSRSMMSLILVAFIVAAPIAWYIMDRWLEGFAYRPPFGISVFVIAGGLTFAIASLTIGMQAARAALTNPVDTLKAE
jgi:putative ABC transport system permease protein